MNSESTISVADVLRKLDERANVRLTHEVEDTVRGINSRITETSNVESFVDFYTWRQMDCWEVLSIASESEGDDAITHIEYNIRG